MPDDRFQERRAIGERVREGRTRVGDSLKELSEYLGIGEAQLSRIESGSIGLPAELVLPLARRIGLSPSYLIEGGRRESSGGSLVAGLQLLKIAKELGLESFHRDRQDALAFLTPFAEQMYGGEIKITGSSLRGLWTMTTHQFVQELKKICTDRPRVRVKVILTHPRIGYARETQEGSPKGTIVLEILRGIRWCIDELRVPVDQVRLSKAHPCMFSIFLDHSDGRGILNPYPLSATSVESIAYGVRRLPDDEEGAARAAYRVMMNANFDRPFKDEKVTVDLNAGLAECIEIVGRKPTSELDKDWVDTLRINLTTLKETAELCNRKSANKGMKSS